MPCVIKTHENRKSRPLSEAVSGHFSGCADAVPCCALVVLCRCSALLRLGGIVLMQCLCASLRTSAAWLPRRMESTNCLCESLWPPHSVLPQPQLLVILWLVEVASAVSSCSPPCVAMCRMVALARPAGPQLGATGCDPCSRAGPSSSCLARGAAAAATGATCKPIRERPICSNKGCAIIGRFGKTRAVCGGSRY